MAAEEMAKNKASNYQFGGKLHRLLYPINRGFKLKLSKTLDFTRANAFRKSVGMYLRNVQWTDIELEVYIF